MQIIFAILIILYAVVSASLMTFALSFCSLKKIRKSLVFQDCFFLIIVSAASMLAFKDYVHNPDLVDLLIIFGLFYVAFFRMPKWGIV